MSRIIIVLLLLSAGGLFGTTPAYSITAIPQESGFSGFINLGAGAITAKSNMIAGNKLATIGKKRIDSLNDSADSKSDGIPLISGELAYTFASTRTQLYLGNSLEDFIRFETATLAGVRQELPDESIVALSYVSSLLRTEVWADPYVVGQDRTKTDRTSSGLRLGYAKILESDFEIQFTWRSIELDDERSGLTQLGQLGLLSPDQAQLLNREGDSYEFEILHPFRFKQGKHLLAPALSYRRMELDGEAMANNHYQGQLTYAYFGNPLSISSNLIFAIADADKTNPIYLDKREDVIYGLSLSIFYRDFLDTQGLNLVGTAAGFRSDSNIDFYDTTIGLLGLSVLYRF
jgi:hypothetical protein